MAQHRLQKAVAATLMGTMLLSTSPLSGLRIARATTPDDQQTFMLGSLSGDLKDVSFTEAAPAATVRFTYLAESGTQDLQWRFAASSEIASVSMQLVPLTGDATNGFTEGAAIYSETVALSTTAPVYTALHQIPLTAGMSYRLKATATLAAGVTTATLPVGVMILPSGTQSATLPASLTAQGTGLTQNGTSCTNNYFSYSGPDKSVQLGVNLAADANLSAVYENLFRLDPAANGSMDQTYVGGLNSAPPGQTTYAGQAATLTSGTYDLTLCGLPVDSSKPFNISATATLEESNGPRPEGPSSDLSSDLTMTGTLNATSPNDASEVPFQLTGTDPVLAEIELSVDPTAVGAGHLEAYHRVAASGGFLSWQNDYINAPSTYIDTVPAGGKYSTSVLLLPGQNQITVKPELLGAGTDQSPYVTGNIPYTVTVRKAVSLPAGGRTIDLGNAVNGTTFVGGLNQTSRHRFHVDTAGLWDVTAPQLGGHTHVTLERITRMDGAPYTETTQETLGADVVAGAKYPFYLVPGEWEVTVTQSKPDGTNETMPSDPAATVPASVAITPWTAADGDLTKGTLDLVTSGSLALKMPPAWAGNYVVVAKAAASSGGTFSSGSTYVNPSAGETATTSVNLASGSTFSYTSSKDNGASHTLTLIPASIIGVTPVTLKGTLRGGADGSASTTIDLGQVTAGWYAVQAKTSAAAGSISVGGTTIPVHGSEVNGSAPAPLLPVSSGSVYVSLNPGVDQVATWEVTLGTAVSYPGRTLSLSGQLVPGDYLYVPLPLGIHSNTDTDFHFDATGPAGSYAEASMTCGSYYGGGCMTPGNIFGQDDPATPDVTENALSGKVTLQQGTSSIQLRRKDTVDGTFTYHITLTLPPVAKFTITNTQGQDSNMVENAPPIPLALGETISLDARDQGTGLDSNNVISGRSLPVTWSVAGSGATPGAATISRSGVLTGIAAGTVTVTAAYTDEVGGTLNETRDVEVTAPVGPTASVQGYLDTQHPPLWLVNGSASVNAPKQVSSLELRADKAGNWVSLAGNAAVSGLGTASVWFSNLDISADGLFPGLGEGWHTIELRATDSVGAVTITEGKYLVDRTAPTVTGFTIAQGDETTQTPVTEGTALDSSKTTTLSPVAADLAGTNPGGVSTVEFSYRPLGTTSWHSIGSASYDETTGNVQWPAGWALSSLPSADYEVQAVAVDFAGNRSQPYKATWHVNGVADTDAPTGVTLGVDTQVNKDNQGWLNTDEYVKGTFTLDVSAYDSGSGLASAQVEYRLPTGKDVQGNLTWPDTWTKLGNPVEWPGESQTWTVPVDTAALKLSDGPVQWHVIVSDISGNKAASDTSPNKPLQTIVANAAPADPATITAAYLPPDDTTTPAKGPRVGINWSQVATATQFVLERQAIAAGTQPVEANWTEVARPGLWQNGVYEDDQGLSDGSVLAYRVKTIDPFDQLSAGSNYATVTLVPDEIAPTVQPGLIGGSVTGGVIRGTATLRIPASDNQRVKKVTVQYSGKSSGTLSGTPAAGSDEVAISWNTTGLDDGTYTLTIIAIDDWNHASAPVTQTVTVDNNPPAAPASATADAPDGQILVNLSWAASTSTDVASYQVFRYDGAAQTLAATVDASQLSYTDTGVVPQHKYTYGILAVDKAGNQALAATHTNEVLVGLDKEPPVIRLASTYATKQLKPRDGDNLPIAAIGFDGYYSTDNVGITSFSWDPGEPGALPIPTDNGKATHVYTHAGHWIATLTARDAAGNESKSSMVVDIKDVGAPSVLVTVRNASQAVIPGATVLVDGGQSYTTDANGQVEVTGDPGPLTLNLFANGYLGSTQSVTVPKTGQSPVNLYLEEGKLVVGSLTQHRLTLDEIQALGIKLDDPANSWVQKIEVKVNYQGGDGDGGGGGGGGTGTLYVNGDNEVVGSSCSGCMIGLIPLGPDENGEPQNGVAIFKIDGEAKWLKEFFKVDAIIVNPSDPAFVLKNGTLTLSKGSGLTIVPTSTTQSQSSVKVKDIAGGDSYQTSWVLRGDKAGVYAIKAQYNGTLVFGSRQVPASLTLQTEDPITVYGDKMIEQTIEAPTDIKEGETIEVKVHLKNTSPVPAYGLSLTMKEDHLLEQGEDATKKIDALAGGDEWVTTWHLKAPGDSPADLDGLWGKDDDKDLDPVENPNYFAKGRVVYRNGDGSEHPVVGAVVSLDGRKVTVTDANGNFMAGTDHGGTIDVRVTGGGSGYRGAWHTTVTIPENQDGGRQEATVEKHPKATADGTGFLISGSIATSLQSGLKALENTKLHDAALLTKVSKWSQDNILNKGMTDGDTRSVDPTDEETLRRLRTVVALMVENDANAKQYLDDAADAMWEGTTGPLSALMETVDVGKLLSKVVKRIPGVRATKLPNMLEDGIDKTMEPAIKRVANWASDQAAKRLPKLSAELKEQVGQQVEDGLTKASEQLQEAIKKQAEEHVQKPVVDAMKDTFKGYVLQAYKKGSDQALDNALTYADLSLNDSTRWWTPGTFSAVSDRYKDLHTISADQNTKLGDIRAKLLAANTTKEILEGVKERSETVSDIAGSLGPNPAAAAVATATTALQKVAESTNLVLQATGAAEIQLGAATDLIRMTTGSRSLLFLNERMAFGAFSQTWTFTKPEQPTTYVVHAPLGGFGKFLLTPLLTGGPLGDLLKKGGVQVQLRSPADLYVCDSNGKCLGIDPATNEEVAPENRIPGGVYSGRGAEPEYVIVPGPSKDLSLQVVGTGDGGDITLEFSRMGYQTAPSGNQSSADETMVVKDQVTPGQKVDYGITLPDADAAEEGAPVAPGLTRAGAALPTLTAPNAIAGQVFAVKDQPLALPVTLAGGSTVQHISVNMPWDTATLGTPTVEPGTGWTLDTAPDDAALADGSLTATLSYTGNPADAPATAFTIHTTPAAIGRGVLRLSGAGIILADANLSQVPHTGSEAELAVTDGTTTLTGSVTSLFGTAIGRSGAGTGTDPVMTAKQARAAKVRDFTAAAADQIAGASVKLWAVDADGNRTGDAAVYQAQTDADGNFSLAGVAPGTYLMDVSAPGLLSRQHKVAISLADSSLGAIDLLAGDLNADGVIDMLDFVVLNQHLGDLSQVTDPDLKQRLAGMDLNRDGTLTADEVAQLKPFFRRAASDD